MPRVSAADGTEIFCEDWGSGSPTEDLRRCDVPTFVMHGDDDQIVPSGASALRAVELLPHASLKVYPGLSHGLRTLDADLVNRDLAAFIRA